MESIGAVRGEAARVAAHIEGAERVVASRSTHGLGRLKRIVRSLLLEELAAYRRAAVFPKNRDFSDRPMPYFIDGDGTRCAMAHLLEVGGATALVARIASERNNAFVRELADEPELLAWLDAAGISVEEAARIQPSYCSDNASYICGGDFQTEIKANAMGVLEVTIVGVTAGTLDVTARVDAVYGETGSIKVGDQVSSFLLGRDLGTKLLVPLHASTVSPPKAATDGGSADGGVPMTVVVDGGLRFTGDEVAGREGHTLTKQQTIDALRSPDCRAKLDAISSYWSEGTCGSESGSGDGGCSTSGVVDPNGATLQILLAIVGTVVARRLARSRQST